MIKILIADDHNLFREGLKAMLEDPSTDIEVIGEAASGQELFPLLEKHDVDLVLLDFNMPEMDGLAATRYIREHFSSTKILVLSMLEDEKQVSEIIKAGAQGYILKTIDKKELIYAIHKVASGQCYITTQIALNLLDKDTFQQIEKHDTEVSTKDLSKRELEVLQLVAKGHTNEQIAEMLFTSRRTIESHRQNLLEKTGSRNTASLIVYATKNNLI